MNIKGKIWFATQFDRDFKTGEYGDGIRLYCDDFDEEYKVITGYSYDGNVLKVKDSEQNVIILDNEPDNKKFENTIYRDWYNLEYIDDDKNDYEPCAYDSLLSLAIDLGTYENHEEQYYDITLYYKSAILF